MKTLKDLKAFSLDKKQMNQIEGGKLVQMYKQRLHSNLVTGVTVVGLFGKKTLQTFAKCSGCFRQYRI
ncbi:hypothetical protein AAH004_07780 [Phocaeicola dorei]|uniref:hypothetical protein n=1 Tax=Phocaeicola dorei TaxID=357276 RepID=UPI0039B66BD9